jgi:serine/threonine protein phosphatase PrpC
MNFTSKLITNVGKVRAANEDNMGEALTPNGHLFVVCDGMGGHVGGATASSIAVSSIIEFFQKEIYENLIQAIDRALSFANEQIYASALNNPELKGMGTTAVVLLIKDEECFIGHVGDSRIYLHSDSFLNRLTKDHSFVQTLVDSGIITDDEAESHPNKNQILQALGIASTVKSTISSVPILPKSGDTFLLCSDGLNGMVKDFEMQNILSKNTIDVAAENLINAALEAGGTDNITVALVKIEKSLNTKSVFKHFNPLVKPDFVSTQQIDSPTQVDIRPKNKRILFLIIGIIVLSVMSGIAYLLLKKDKKPKEKTLKFITRQKIEDYPAANQDELLKLKVSDVANDTIEIKGSENVAIVKDSFVVAITKKTQKTTKKENQTSGKEKTNKNQKTTPTKPAATRNQTDSLKVTSKSHQVKSGETLLGIVNQYKDSCNSLTSQKIKKFNENNGDLNTTQREKLAKDELEVGMVLIIPCD